MTKDPFFGSRPQSKIARVDLQNALAKADQRFFFGGYPLTITVDEKHGPFSSTSTRTEWKWKNVISWYASMFGQSIRELFGR